MPFTPIDTVNYGVQPLHGGLYLSTVDGSQLKFRSADLANLKGGVVVKLTAAGEVGIYNGTADKALYPLGIFIGEADKQPNDTAVLVGPAIVLVDNWDKTVSPLSGFALGTGVVVTTAGLLTVRSANDQRVVGVVTKVPTSTSDTLGIALGAPAIGHINPTPAS